MRKISQIPMLALFLVVSVLSISCQKDDMESITLKSSGSLSIAVLDGEAPVANAKVWFYNEHTGNEIDVLLTDEEGKIDFGDLNEGTYAVEIEVKSPKYAMIVQEIQVVSGASINKTIQVGDYVGTYNVVLANWENGDVVKEDLGLGLALIPESDAFYRAETDEERIALATAIKYFGTEGEVAFELPVADYQVYTVRGDSIISSFSNLEVYKLEDRLERLSVNVTVEKLLNKASWSVADVKDETDANIADFPVSSVRFYLLNGNRRFEMKMKNGVVLSGYYNISNGGQSINLYSYSSNNSSFSFSLSYSYTPLQFDAQGKLILKSFYFSMTDHSGDTDFSDTNLSVTLE